jgi:hypothetical protein
MHNDTIPQLRDLAREIQNYQIERGLSDVALCRKVSQLGSTKTYKRILDANDPLDELNLARQLVNYSGAVEYIKSLRASERPPEPEYDDFANVVDSLAAVARAMQEDSIARFVVIQGENGTGKDAVLRALTARWGKVLLPVEASELWRESLSVPLADIIASLNVRRQRDGETSESFKVPMHPHARLLLILEELAKRKLILCVNEGHHMGPRALNLLKTIINKTGTVVVMECVPKLLTRLVNSNYEEAIQLFGNRLCERVNLDSPRPDEIELLFERRGLVFAEPKDGPVAAGLVGGEAPQFGNWRYVVQVCREARDTAAGKPVTLDQFSSAVGRAKARRIMRQHQSN